MSFQPILPFSGLPGWRLLQGTLDKQLKHFASSPLLSREKSYFEENISKVQTAADLVADRTLLKVALGAFGLEGDIQNRAFIRKVLESDLGDPKSLSARLTDPRYKELAEAFSLSASGKAKTNAPGFAAAILQRYTVQSFEVALGEQDTAMRLAMTAKRELPKLALQDISDTSKWYRAMSQPPIRSFLETAFGLPSDFGKIDIDQQQSILADKALNQFNIGSFSELAQPENLEKVIERFHLRNQVSETSQMTSQSIAIALLS